jgi:hypothetical protein
VVCPSNFFRLAGSCPFQVVNVKRPHSARNTHGEYWVVKRVEVVDESHFQKWTYFF